MKIPKISKLLGSIDSLFNNFKDKVLGQLDGHDPKQTLPGLFIVTSVLTGQAPNKKLLAQLLRGAKGYLDIQKKLAKTKVRKLAETYQLELQHGKNPPYDEFKESVAKVLNTATNSIKTILESESNHIKNFAKLGSITSQADDYGVDDPVIYFECPLDAKTCDTCLTLHFLGTTPRAWYLSEAHFGYGHKDDETPAWGGQHPNCRAQVRYIPPGYGFKGLNLVFIATDYDIIKDQRQ